MVRYFIDSEFDGHNGRLLSMAVVPEEGGSIHIETLATDDVRDPWVVENVVSKMSDHQAESMAIVTINEVGRELPRFCGMIRHRSSSRIAPWILRAFAPRS